MISFFKKTPQQRGQWAEQFAEKYLRQNGLNTLHKNYRYRNGEIDIIMQEQNTLVFVEVRYRNHQQFGGGLESIDSRKQQKIQRTAMHFLQTHKQHQNDTCRFDAVIMTGEPSQPDLNWIKNAF